MLEILVHARIGRLPESQRWIKVEVPKDVSFESLESAAVPGWDAEDSASARAAGDAWYDKRRSLLLAVPSVVTNGQSWNVLIHQEHPEFPRLHASEPREMRWDLRFKL